ncbi:hypothetical protein chiPu_0026333 [Chiloscyllium punctatum]|uniref:TERF1-interacting nuclear factor 2 N-terminal domain-containing protein n=1 Tax=Chiloscyllium punctatum TaxID=137246 RepID=A0A401THX2_CHIPU|nr:hypothetical protein [Chiloscyllium punctatum]
MPKQYGEEFLTALQRLLWEYLLRLDITLPRLCLQQLRDVANLSDPRHAEFLIGYLRELDPRSLQALAVTPGPSPSGSPPRDGAPKPWVLGGDGAFKWSIITAIRDKG